jgi:hypothetical protein
VTVDDENIIVTISASLIPVKDKDDGLFSDPMVLAVIAVVVIGIIAAAAFFVIRK